jgi:hypothetical protein
MKALRTPYRLCGGFLREELEMALPPYALKHLGPAFDDHDPDAASRLVGSAPNQYRGEIALAAYWSGVPNPAYRALLANVWDHDHHHLLAAVRGGAAQVRRMIRRAEFAVPFADPVTVFRGGSEGGNKVARGLSWTTDRDCACWFALRFSQSSDRKPLVIRAVVPATAIIMWHDGRSEQEVILAGVPLWQVDNAGDWAAAAARHATRIHANNLLDHA